MTSALAKLSEEQHENECVKFALKVRSAWSLNNYRKFYKLYLTAPKMSGYLIDWFIDRERKNHFKLMCKVYVICSFLIYYFLHTMHFIVLLAICFTLLGKYDNGRMSSLENGSRMSSFLLSGYFVFADASTRKDYSFKITFLLKVNYLTNITYFLVSINVFLFQRPREVSEKYVTFAFHVLTYATSVI